MSEPLVISHVVLWLLIMIQGLVLMGLVQAVFKRQVVGVDSSGSGGGSLEGREAPAFTAEEVSGEIISSRELADRMRVFVFVSLSCTNCSVTLAELEAIGSKSNGNIIVVCQSNREACRRLVDTYGLAHRVVVDDDLRLSKSFGVWQVPAAVLVNENNRIEVHGRRLEDGDIEELLRTAEKNEVGEVIA